MIGPLERWDKLGGVGESPGFYATILAHKHVLLWPRARLQNYKTDREILHKKLLFPVG